MKAYLREALYVPARLFTDEHAEELSVKVWAMGAAKDDYEVVQAYREGERYVAVPRQWGLENFPDLTVIDQRSPGTPARFPKQISLWDYQEPIVDRLVTRIGDGGDFIFQAATGKGKTVMMLAAAARIGTTTLVVVDQENLMAQWKEKCLGTKPGLGLKESDIGIVQGKKADWRGKKIVIAMMQSLSQREYEDEFYDAFGLVIFDESHTAGAPTFSETMLLFSARSRVGVSATPDRRDSLRKLIRWNLGKVEIRLLDEHAESSVYYLKSFGVYSWYANVSSKTGRYITEISDDAERNWLACRAIMWLYESGRDVLVIGDRIEQLWNLQNMLIVAGIPEEETGLYTGYRPTYGYCKDATPPRRPGGWERGSEYVPIKVGLLSKKQSRKALEEIKANAKIVLATYGMFAKGVDVPRLGSGIDVTPRSTAQQVHGRILRKQQGKKKPIWVTIRDVNSYRAEHQFAQRVEEYRKSNAEIFEWRLGKGIKAREAETLLREVRGSVAELKKCRIITRLDGSYTLATPTTPSGLKGLLDSTTVAKTPSRRRRLGGVF